MSGVKGRDGERQSVCEQTVTWMDGTANANEFFSRLVTQLTERLVARGADLATTRDLLASRYE